MVSTQPTARYRGMCTRWSSHSSRGPIVMAIEGSTQSLWPVATTMTGRMNAAINSMMVARVMDRSMRFASGLVNPGPVPAVNQMPYATTITVTTQNPIANGLRTCPWRLKAPRTNQKAAKASWMKPPTASPAATMPRPG